MCDSSLHIAVELSSCDQHQGKMFLIFFVFEERMSANMTASVDILSKA